MIFPSRVLRRQLDDAQQRLREMEEELEMIRNQELRKRKRRKKTKVRAVLFSLKARKRD